VFLLHALEVCLVSCRMRERGFDVGFDFIFIDPCAGRQSLVCSRLGVPAACSTAGLMLALYFIFIDPCAGWHLLSLLRQRK
jgi:hypothetical protein